MRNTCVIGRRGQGPTDLCHDDVWLTMDVRGGESQQAIAGVDEQVLPAVVLDEALAVIASVIFQNESRRRVIEVCPTDELLTAVVEVGLDLRVWEAGLDEQPAKPCLHRRFGRRCECGKRSKSACSGATVRRLRVALQTCRVGKACGDRHVDGDESLDCRQTKAKIDEGAANGRCAQPSDSRDIVPRNLAVANAEPSSGAHAGADGHDDLDWIERAHVEAKKPGRGRARKDRLGRQRAAPGREHQQRILAQTAPAIELRAEMSPGFAPQAA